MCILFLNVCGNPGIGKYKLILASNRDEYFARPTKVAEEWSEYPDIIGGQDMEPGKEGGTWLAMSKTGKIGVLLNILTSDPFANSPGKLGRGSLVINYLKEDDLDGTQYCEVLHKNAELYNPFNIVTIDLKKKNGPAVTYYSSTSGNGNPLQLVCDNTYAFGNSAFESPFMKVTDGYERMVEVAKLYNNTAQKQCLLDELLKILKCKKQFSDPQMKLQAPKIPSETLTNMSSKYCFVPNLRYGSRTHTVILVDNENKAEFHEWTLDEKSLREGTDNMEWIHTEFYFNLR